MSYDLFLKSESTPLSMDAFTSYFGQRPRYTVTNGQALYESDDTGVYFSFEYDADSPNAVAFNLNYFRPHFFGLEAAKEVDAFVSSKHLAISDPQIDGMADGPFSIAGFLRGWNTGNRMAYHAILSSEKRPDANIFPTAGLERVWKWNFDRESLQSQIGDSLFVPKFMFMKGHPMARAAIVWPDACPIYMPRADLVFILRDELSSNHNAVDSREITVVAWRDVEAVVASYPYDDKLGCYRLEYQTAPSGVEGFVRSLPLLPRDQEAGLASADVLNAELVDECTKSAKLQRLP